MPYLAHFGLREHPFALTPNTQKYFPTTTNTELLESLTYAVKRNGGIMKIVGPVGTGKTLLCRMLLHRLEGVAEVAYLTAPSGDGDSLLGLVCGEFGLDVPAQRAERLQTLNDFLVGRHAEGMDCVLLVDEAQALGPQGLEAIRLLSNLETETRKLLQIILFAQTELDHLLAQQSLRQLDQRIAFSFRTTPLAGPEAVDYIHHRLRISRIDGVDYEIFEPKGIDAIVRASAGIPRVVNILCDKALLIAYGEGHRSVTRHHARAAIKDSPTIVAHTGRHHVTGRAAWAAGIAGMLAGAAVAGVLINLTPVGDALRGILLSSQIEAAAARPEAAPTPTPTAAVDGEAAAEAVTPPPVIAAEVAEPARAPAPATPAVDEPAAGSAVATVAATEAAPPEPAAPAHAAQAEAPKVDPVKIEPVAVESVKVEPDTADPDTADSGTADPAKIEPAAPENVVAVVTPIAKPALPAPAPTKAPQVPTTVKKPAAAPVERKTAAVAPPKKPVTPKPVAKSAAAPASAPTPVPAGEAAVDALGPGSAKRTADGRWQWN